MSNTIQDRTLALAGIFQAASLVNQMARHGRAEPTPMETSIRSLFVTTPEAAEDVYGSSAELRQGLEVLIRQLGSDASQRDLTVTRYALALLHLERKLARRKDLLDTIAQGLERTRHQVEHFSFTHTNVVASLADIYLNSISTLKPRIMVYGEHGHLNHTDNANGVRALLLAGMRSAVLWRQCGGSRLQLLFKRKDFLAEARRLQGRRSPAAD